MKDLPQKLAFVDVETTGSNPRGDRVMEIGVVRVENGKVVEKMDTLINPLVPPPEFIVNMTGINPFDLENAPLFSEVAYELQEMLDGAVFVAHNARFDYGFIKNEFLRHDMKFSAKVLCTVKLARKIYPNLRRYNLDSIINNFGIKCKNRHRAYDDAYCLWDFYNISKENGSKKKLKSAVAELLKAPSVPTQLDKSLLDNLHEGPGVYVFQGDIDNSKSVLYIGKSINIKDRVKSHFSSDYQNSKDIKISRYINHIETVKTAGELGALLREANMIKQMQPIYNRRLRRNSDMVAALIDESGDFFTVKLDRVRNIEIKRVEKVLAVFRSIKQAKQYFSDLGVEYELCPKLLGFEKTKSSCFNFQLKRCRGACVGEENALSYNLRFVEAVAKRRVPHWPFSDAISIEEKGHKHIEKHLINKWCYLGSLEFLEDSEPIVHSNEVRFDWDVFLILKKFILKKRSDISIKNANQDEINQSFGLV